VKPLISIIAVLGLATALSACNGGSNPLSLTYKPQDKSDLLSESGFRTMSLNTPAKVAAFKNLPQQRLTQTTFKGKKVWVYPDRNICGCLYVGGQTAYLNYIKKATDQMADARVNQMYSGGGGDPYNPAQENAYINWGDAWDVSDAYGLYLD
jgi:hypothetical protein